MTILAIRKLADKTTGERIVRYDPLTGEKKLVNPATPGDEHEPWPLAGVQFEGDIPFTTSVPTDYVDRAVREGWMERVNERAVVRPAGRTQTEWSSSQTGTPHTFIQCDEIIFKTVEGDFRFKVTLNPDKYAADLDPEQTVTSELYEAGKTRVVNFYRLERVGG